MLTAIPRPPRQFLMPRSPVPSAATYQPRLYTAALQFFPVKVSRSRSRKGPQANGSLARDMRLNRGGNRAVNCALHMIAVTQARGIGPGGQYIDKQLASGKTRTEALQLLRRQLSDSVFRALLTDEHRQRQPASIELLDVS